MISDGLGNLYLDATRNGEDVANVRLKNDYVSTSQPGRKSRGLRLLAMVNYTTLVPRFSFSSKAISAVATPPIISDFLR